MHEAGWTHHDSPSTPSLGLWGGKGTGEEKEGRGGWTQIKVVPYRRLQSLFDIKAYCEPYQEQSREYTPPIQRLSLVCVIRFSLRMYVLFSSLQRFQNSLHHNAIGSTHIMCGW